MNIFIDLALYNDYVDVKLLYTCNGSMQLRNYATKQYILNKRKIIYWIKKKNKIVYSKLMCAHDLYAIQ